MSVLITGGAGYIGCHTSKRIEEQGGELLVLDNFSTGLRHNARWGNVFEGDVTDNALLRRLLREHNVTAVIHLAASAHVGESIRQPELYFSNNIIATGVLLEAMAAEGVQQLLFASSCSVYGDSESERLQESEATAPVSPYGESKLAIERLLPWYERAHGLRWIALRYFNVAGAEDDLGEEIRTSKRLVPRALHAAMDGGQKLQIFGSSFDTSDGSAVRDYVHVSDVADANLLALRWLECGNSGAIVNIGSGTGTSVLQTAGAIERVTGKSVQREIQAARPGDPARAIADASCAQRTLGWQPRHSGIEQIVHSLVRSCELRSASLA